MLRLLTVLLSALAANAMIYFGIAAVNGRIAPSALARFYAATSPTSRTAMAVLAVSFPANLLINWCFRAVPVSTASMAVLSTTVVVMIASVLILDGPMSGRAWLASAAVLAAGLWFAYERSVG